MRIGLALPQLGESATPESISRFARDAEAHGFDSLTVHERMFSPLHEANFADGVRDLSALELLSFVAGVTSTIRLSTSVITLAYHRPVMLAKASATLDVLSNGRLDLGVGLGLNKEEHRQNEVDFHKRGKRSAEFIRALKTCWMPDPVEFHGEFFDIPPSHTSPKPVQRDADGNPTIPLIGGFRSKPGQRRTAELCDGWQTAGKDLADALADYEEANRAATEEFGRPRLPFYWRVWAVPPSSDLEPPEQTGDRVVAFWGGDLEAMADSVRAAREAGVDQLILDTNRFQGEDAMDWWEHQPETFAPLVEAAHAG